MLRGVGRCLVGGEVSDGATQKLERQGLWLGDNPVLRGDDELKTSAWTLSYWEHVNTHTHTHTHTHTGGWGASQV